MVEPRVLTVAELTRRIADCLEGNFAGIAVRGEISGCSIASSGHIYLTLKDDEAQIRAVMWRSRASRLKFQPVDGLQVVAIGGIDVYAARGSYQLVVQELIPQGVGPLELAFRQLCEKLSAEGLFAPERKRPLPRFPRRIALVTSPQSAAVRDMLQIITRRWRNADVIIVPVPVQGEGAAAHIARAIGLLPSIEGVDVAIVGRGGGSLEDLWSFNEEVVARAIAASLVPIVSAVGHEIDVTIADLVADRRALTPSEAGELVVLDDRELLAGLEQIEGRLCGLLRARAAAARDALVAVAARRVFQRPAERLHELARRVDELDSRLRMLAIRRCETARGRWSTLAAALDALSPLRVLHRGYSLTSRADTGELIRRAEDVRPGDRLATRLSDGVIHSRVEADDT